MTCLFDFSSENFWKHSCGIIFPCSEAIFLVVWNCVSLFDELRLAADVLLQVTRCQTSSDNDLSQMLYCKKHSGEQGKYVCQSCQLIVCTACIVNDHAEHDVAEMTSVLRQQQQDVNNLRTMVQSKNDQLKTRIQELEALRQVSDICYFLKILTR